MMCVMTRCLGVSLFLCVALIYSAWDTLEPWEIGLDYNTILQSISPDAWGTGRHWLGLGHRFVKPLEALEADLRSNHRVTKVKRSQKRSNNVSNWLTIIEI